MQPFTYSKVQNTEDALKSSGRFLSGGTSLIDLMKLDVETPSAVIDVNQLPFNKIEKTKSGGWLIGGAVKNSEIAHHEDIKKYYPLLSDAILSGATVQLRNKASTAGNILQRTRCVYFRDTSKACNKRQPGSGCSAIEGFNRNLAILGTSPKCIANNPSDMNVAMTALDAKIHLQSAKGSRAVPYTEFYLLPGDTPEKETVIQPGELITGVELDPPLQNFKSTYLKLRDRASYEFALASAAVIVVIQGGRIDKARVAMGGIGAKPWRMPDVEQLLEGQAPSPSLFQKAADVAVKDAKPQSMNAFKVELARRCLIHALTQVTSKA